MYATHRASPLIQVARQIGKIRLREPEPDAGEMLGAITGLSRKMRHSLREIHRVLSGAAADLQYRTARRQPWCNHGENGVAITLTGFRTRLAHGLIYCILRQDLLLVQPATKK